MCISCSKKWMMTVILVAGVGVIEASQVEGLERKKSGKFMKDTSGSWKEVRHNDASRHPQKDFSMRSGSGRVIVPVVTVDSPRSDTSSNGASDSGSSQK